MADRIWITWENQRRSRELAAHFQCRIFVFEGAGFLRYPKAIFHTLWTLMAERPRVVFVQNPSMVLAALAVTWGLVSPSKVVVDRHTTFLLNHAGPNTVGLRLFKALHRYTLKHADLTIVTNEYLATLVRERDGRPAVLPDKLPTLNPSPSAAHEMPQGVPTVLFIASFAEDEPIEEAVSAASDLARELPLHMFVSGRVKERFARVVESAPDNITFTGFLSDTDFISLLLGVDVVMVLTTSDHTMLCGCYEAVSAGKPLVTSDKAVLRDYFTGAIFTAARRNDIRQALRTALFEKEALGERIRVLRSELARNWVAMADRVESSIDS